MRGGDPAVGPGAGAGRVRFRRSRAAGRWAWMLTALVVLVATACRRPMPGGEEESARAWSHVPGCWSLDVTAAGDSTPAWLSGATLPTELGLDTARVSSGAEAGDAGPVYVADSYHGIRRESRPFSAWRRTGGDSLMVYRPGALAGLLLRLGPRGGDFSGVLVSFTDALEPGQPSTRTAPVRATPAPCPSGGSTAGPSSAP